MSNTITTPESIPSFVEIANLFKGSPEKESALVHWIRPFVHDSLIPQEWWIKRIQSDNEYDSFETAKNVILSDKERSDLEKEIADLLEKNFTACDIYFSLRDTRKLPMRRGLFMSLKPFLSIVKNVRGRCGIKGKHMMIRESKTKQMLLLWDKGDKNIYSIASKVGTDYYTTRTALIRHGRIEKNWSKHEPTSL